MLVQVSPNMTRITISTTNGFFDLMKFKVAARYLSYRTLLYIVLFLAFLLPFLFSLTAVITLEDVENCTSLDCLGKRLGPRLLRRADASPRMAADVFGVLLQASSKALPKGMTIPETFNDLVAEMRTQNYNAKTFAMKLKAMVEHLEEKSRSAKLQENLYKHFASTSIPKGMSCLCLKLADEYSSKAHARRQLPSPELVTFLTDNSYYHFVLATDNVLAASVVVSSTVKNFAKPEMVVFHLITDKKTYAAMHAWFAFYPLSPAIIEVKGVHQFEWLTKENVPVLEAMETHLNVQRYYHGDHIIDTNFNDSPRIMASKLESRSPKYISILNHLRIYLPELFPDLHKVVFLDDDIVIQRDLSPLWHIDLHGKVNGAVETCREQCAWAYGMNIFDLQAWRNTNIRETYHYWLKENLDSNLSLWRFGTLPPSLIAFCGHVHPIDPSWHMLGLGYQFDTKIADVKKAAVIHYNGQAKPWLDIAIPKLRPFWTKYVNYSSDFIRECNIMDY